MGLADDSLIREAAIKFIRYVDRRSAKEQTSRSYERYDITAILIQGDVRSNGNTEAVAVRGNPRVR